MKRAWSAVGFVCLVLTLGGTTSWGGPPNPTPSDAAANTAGGTNALVNNNPGNALLGHNNTAFGNRALQSNTTGDDNTAIGAFALQKNTTIDTAIGRHNTATGAFALGSNITGHDNTASGFFALGSNTTGHDNTAFGKDALQKNLTGLNNTATGAFALELNTTGHDNTATGRGALFANRSGNDNIAVGSGAGVILERGDHNIYLGNHGVTFEESNTMRLGHGGLLDDTSTTRTFIEGIFGAPVGGRGALVVIDNDGQLGTVSSSARYKRDVRDIGDGSQGLYQLRPVAFHYKQDAQGVQQYGLIAEEVAKVYPELAVRGAAGEVETVQYHEIIPMLLNELQHQQQTLNAQSQQIAELRAQNERLQAALAQQTATLAARLERLEAEAVRTATLATR